MIGLIFFGVMGLYIWGSIKLTKNAVDSAHKAGRPSWHYGLPVGLLMYSLMFWDWIPTVATHQYYCARDAGLSVYKTLDNWKLENPGVAEILLPIKRAKWQHEGKITRVPMNQRFIWEFEDSQHWLKLHKRDQRIIDTETNEILARHINYDSALRNPFVVSTGISLRDYKFWLAWGTESCFRRGNREKWLVGGSSFRGLKVKFKNIGSGDSK